MKDFDKGTVMAGGGILLRIADEPLIAIVQLRKDKSWVLPKGKVKDGETAIAAAAREVIEETGHDVTVHEFLGTMSVVTDRWHKVVQFWRMTDEGRTPHPLTPDVKDVKWLPLSEAMRTLTRRHEKIFLKNVGAEAVRAARTPAHTDAGALLEGMASPIANRETRGRFVDMLRGWFRSMTQVGAR
jgi:8-oxo-dGTP diphosphatase